MKPFLVAFMAVALASVACSTAFDQPNATATPIPATQTTQTQPQPKIVPTATIDADWQEYRPVGFLNVRACPSASCQVIDILDGNSPVIAKCSILWCQLKDGGYVSAGCLGQGDGKCLQKLR